MHGLEAQRGPREPFHCAIALLHDSIEILGVAAAKGSRVGRVVVRHRRRVGPTLIDGDFLRPSLGANGLAQEGLGRVPITSRRQEKVNRVALCVHRAI